MISAGVQLSRNNHSDMNFTEKLRVLTDVVIDGCCSIRNWTRWSCAASKSPETWRKPSSSCTNPTASSKRDFSPRNTARRPTDSQNPSSKALTKKHLSLRPIWSSIAWNSAGKRGRIWKRARSTLSTCIYDTIVVAVWQKRKRREKIRLSSRILQIPVRESYVYENKKKKKSLSRSIYYYTTRNMVLLWIVFHIRGCL